MSDSEDDLVILDEIRALEDFLAADEGSEVVAPEPNLNLEKSIARQPNLTNSTTRPRESCSRGFGEVPTCNGSEIHSRRESKCHPKSALEVNAKLIELLSESKRELMAMLERCVENKAILEERIKERSKTSRNTRIHITSAGMPYFKDTKQFLAPRNDDALCKTQNGELQVVHLRCTSAWTPRDRNILWKAIRQEACGEALKVEQMDATSSSNPGATLGAKRLNLPKNFKALVGPNGQREFDWMKIAAMDFDNRHSAEECRVMWRVFLHPDINRYRWTKEEDVSINKLSQRLKHQDWDLLARELGTNRSGYQCFIRYNTKNQAMCLKELSWSDEEDIRLRRCVDRFKIGHYVPWGIVGKYMDGRSKMQVYYRWKYNAAPHLTKGRFTAEEDAALLEAVKKHSTNFGKISNELMPHRTSVQLSEHYCTLVQRKRGIPNKWTIYDDARVIKLYKKYGSDWSRIAENFPGKTRTQLRHRHKSILRYWARGISLYEIPRGSEEEMESAKFEEEEIELLQSMERERVNRIHSKYCKEILEVDLKLIMHFQLAPPLARPGRKQKYYKGKELEETTRKLNVLLDALKADLAIPEETEEAGLAEKDKQLLDSLRDYRQARIDHARSLYENLEYSRNFFSEKPREARELHYHVLCDGECNKKERFRLNERIDYEAPGNLADSLVSLNLELETPAIVSERIGLDESEDFDRLIKVLSTRKLQPRKTSAVRKIYVLGPQTLANVAAANFSRTSGNPENNSQTEDNAKTKRRRKPRGNKANTWESSISEGIVYRPDRTIDFVEPNYHTLLGLQHIIAGEENVPKTAVRQEIMSRKARKAMDKLKTRLLQLFRYPVGLSHVLRPEVYPKSVPAIGFVDCGAVPEDPNVDTAPPPPKRRKRNASGNPPATT